MVSVLDLMQGGFPSRTAFKDLYDMYAKVLPPQLAALDPRTFCKALFKALGLNEDDFQFGVSRVFFRPGKFAEFDTIMKADPANLVAMVQKVIQWLLLQRWKKLAWASVASLKFAAKIRARAGAAVTTQKVIRMYLARSIHKPRYMGLRDINNLRNQVPTMYKIIEKLKNKEKIVKTIEDIEKSINDASGKIKNSSTIDRPAIQKMVQEIQSALDKNLVVIQKEQEKQKLAEEVISLSHCSVRLTKYPGRASEEACRGDGARAQAQGG